LLAPNVAFWKQVYTEHGVGDFVLHDRDHLGVIYAVIRVPENGNQFRAVALAKPEIERARGEYRDILLRLADGVPSEELGADGRRVASMWGCPCAPDRLRRAAENIRAQQGLREKVEEGLHRAQSLLPRIVTILRKHDVPVELAALPLVESTFNPKAYSKAGAAGLWQFIRSTGKQYSLVTRKQDHRRDPLRATEAAAKLLRNNYEALGSWPLAIVAYNHGHAGIQTASSVVGSTAIEDIIARYDGPRFGFASKNFYAEFLAALEVVHPYLVGHGKPPAAKKRPHGTQHAALREQRPPASTSVPEKTAPAPLVESDRQPEPAVVLINPTPFDRSLTLDEIDAIDLSIDLSSVAWLLEQPTVLEAGVGGDEVPPIPLAEGDATARPSQANGAPHDEQPLTVLEPVSSPPISF
jgi:hypothetical protein